jgi:hypothetical protein
MSQILNVGGQKYEITNWDDFKDKLLTGVGFQIEDEIIKLVDKMKLVDTGKYKQGVTSEVVNGELIITNTAPYAVYLEYGTYDYWRSFGLKSFPKTPDPKKKDIKRSEAKKLPKGGQPFAPYRRVLYNKAIMERVVDKAAKLASK